MPLQGIGGRQLCVRIRIATQSIACSGLILSRIQVRSVQSIQADVLAGRWRQEDELVYYLPANIFLPKNTLCCTERVPSQTRRRGVIASKFTTAKHCSRSPKTFLIHDQLQPSLDGPLPSYPSARARKGGCRRVGVWPAQFGMRGRFSVVDFRPLWTFEFAYRAVSVESVR